MRDLIARFLRDDSGTAAIEYGVLAAMIAVPLIPIAKDAGLAVSAIFNSLADEMK